ncbi:type IV pilus assembly protein PilM [Candidatus Woesebacteria bacterium]|nr:type IV pilus assembly protein PilM [Candidatus Woesebacteria bacterium]
MPAVALDIGTYSIKVVHATPGKKPGIKRIAEVFNTIGIALPTDDATQEKLLHVLETTFSDYDLPRNDVRLSIPETVVSTKVISIPPLSDAELASAINWQAEQHIPIPPEELLLEYQVLYRPQRNEKVPMRVLLVGVRKQLMNRFVGMFNQLGIEPTVVETHMLSILRSLNFEKTDPTTLIVHIGASSMNLCLVHEGELRFVLSQLNGGQLLTKSLEQTLGMDSTQSEQYKRTYGLDPAQFQGKVRDALVPATRVLVSELRKAIQFFTSQNPQESVKRVVLCGGSAILPGLVQFITDELGTEVLVAAPFANASGLIPEQVNQPAMVVPMGLLAREL